ncbi:hypothetical protein ACQP04_03015 [Pseudonocardia halophobica]|uniref:hypothetical protein n=1 Tax=Pseudonocardia halophobica TaxID=29401 RepID=UPI003D8EF0CA
MDSVAVLSNAMTDYLLTKGTSRAHAAQAPAHMAAYLEATGHRIVRSPAPEPVDRGRRDLVARIAALIDWPGCCSDRNARHWVVRQVLGAVTDGPERTTDPRRVA